MENVNIAECLPAFPARVRATWPVRDARRPIFHFPFSTFHSPFLRALSLAELMIAIVILGLGLLIVASMFPIAWMRARDHVEFNEVRVATDSAETLLKLKLQVAAYNPPDGADCSDWDQTHLCFDRTSFLGDLGIYLAATSETLDGSDRRVHPVNMYSMAVDPEAYEAGLPVPFMYPPENEVFVPENPCRLEFPDLDLEEFYPKARIAFEDRLLPPLPVKLNPDLAVNKNNFSEAQMNTILAQWYAQLRTRRFGWAVLARMNNGDGNWIDPEIAIAGSEDARDITYRINKGGPIVLHSDAFDDPRVFTMYYVTLRRTQDTFRFPQQSAVAANLPSIPPNGNAVEVQALGPEFDTVLPTPWRVQVYVPNPPDLEDATGVPSEVEVNTTDVQTGPIVTQFLTRGAYMIDEENGQVYQVVRRKLTNTDRSAILTLDKEITEADVRPTGLASGASSEPYWVRTVWVFPPPVEAARGPDGELIIAGTQPVVGIEVRPLVMTP